MKERKIRLVLIMLLISMFSVYAILLQFSGKAEEVEIGLGVEFNTHATPMWVAIHTGLMEKHGIKT
ncbi:MAG: hypothetical protein RMH75_07785, partial [Archaeoglobaceae archaeon]|nr:hypothetical protein [Archaeoglobaceae archaeon]MDW7990537.1 hypothetical protein [Archaeoglobaceae archaeon]